MTNMRHFSNADAIAAASPSIDTYLRSASIQNLLPANIRRQPSRQQTKALSVVHEQEVHSFFAPVWSEAGDTILFKCSDAIPDLINYDLFEMLECSFEAPREVRVPFVEISEGEHDWTQRVRLGHLVN